MRSVFLLVALGSTLVACSKDTDEDTTGTTDVVGGQDTGADGVDADGDGYDSVESGGTDCDDGNAAVNPGAAEVCGDAIDNDCDGDVDEDGQSTWYADADGDGWGDEATATVGCEAPEAGWVGQGGDCDDADPESYPGAPELCDEVDNDCDGDVDDGAGTTWYADGDGDGYGDPDGAVVACNQPSGTVADASDCDDADPAVHPGATEVCDGVDDDCDGTVDGADAVDAMTFYADRDGDGYGDPDSTTLACSTPSGFTDNDLDCQDGSAEVHPGAAEVCGNGIDDDCDGTPTGCLPWGDESVSDADAIFRGATAGERAGQGDPGVAAAGDLNGDGYGDILVAALRESTVATYAGAVYVVYGPASGEESLANADAVFYGEGEWHFAGRSLAGLGDVNGDGFDDFAVGAQGEDSVGSSGGAAYVVYGPVSGASGLGGADAKMLAENAGDLVADVVGVGDVNGDGVPDMMVGAQLNDDGGTDAGVAYLLHGPISGTFSLAAADARIVGASAGDQVGSSIGGGGDLDGDGVPDLIVGAVGLDEGGEDAGGVYVLLGPVSGTTSATTAYATYTGEAAGDGLGYGVSVAYGGDVNGDGYGDIVAGAHAHSASWTGQGAAYVIYGPPSSGVQDVGLAAGAKLLGENQKDYTGDSVDGPGDVNGDGYDDLIVGSGYVDAGASNGGASYLVLGPVSGTRSLGDAAARMLAEGAEDRARTRGAGDVNGDGYADVMVTAQLNDVAGTDAGAAYLFLGGSW